MKPHSIAIVTQLFFGTFYVTLASKDYTKERNLLNCENGTLLSQNICIPSSYLEGEVPEKPTVVTTRVEINNIR